MQPANGIGARSRSSASLGPRLNSNVSRHVNAALELHDSKVQSIDVSDGQLRVVFSEAYIHHSTGRPAIDPGSGYIQQAELLFSRASWSGSLSESTGTISDGFVSVAGEQLSVVPVPFTAAGPVSSEIVFVTGTVVTVSAASVSCKVFGIPRFVEAYDG